jgi:hypothetical protein
LGAAGLAASLAWLAWELLIELTMWLRSAVGQKSLAEKNYLW